MNTTLQQIDQRLTELEADAWLRHRPAAGQGARPQVQSTEIEKLQAALRALPGAAGASGDERRLLELRLDHLAHLDAGNWQSALDCAHRALSLCRDRPALHAGAACALARLERAPEALLHLDALVDSLARAHRGDDPATALSLARALTDRGVCRYDAGQVRESADDFTRALDALATAPAAASDPSLDAEAALALHCRGVSRAAMGDFAGAIDDLDAAIARRRGPASAGDPAALRALAGSLNCRANAHSARTALGRAHADYDEAIALYERLADAGDADTALELACVLVNRGMTRRAQARPDAACADYDRAAALYRAQLARYPHREHRADLAWCLTHRSYALHEQKKWDAAAADLHEAIDLYSALPGEELTAAGLRRVLAELDALRRAGTSDHLDPPTAD